MLTPSNQPDAKKAMARNWEGAGPATKNWLGGYSRFSNRASVEPICS